MSSFPSTTNLWGIVGIVGVLACACATSSEDDPYNEIMHGTIAYPFASPSAPLGVNQPQEKFVIRSAVGNREYAIEIPGGARDFDVEVPLAQINTESVAGVPDHLGSPATTDRELVASLPDVAQSHPTDTALLDGAFGVGDPQGPSQAPSYAMGISKINEHYKMRRFEYALIEINNLLAFYPNSAKLLKMKGTVLVKMRNFQLAERSWSKALELAPEDKTLQAGLKLLQARQATGH